MADISSREDFRDPLGVKDPWADLRHPTKPQKTLTPADGDLYVGDEGHCNDGQLSSNVHNLKKLTIADTPGVAGTYRTQEQTDDMDSEYYLSQISPTTSKSLELISSVTSAAHNGSIGSRRMVADTDIDSDEHDLFIVVDNPEKHATTMESYITFRIVTKTTRSEFESSETQVRRRYNDFLWLRQRLEETQQTLIIPPLPEKHSGLKRFDRFNEDFVKTRAVALQTFLQRIADHPILSFNKNFFIFLTAKVWEFQAAKKEGSGMITRWTDSIHNISASYMIKHRTPEFSDATGYINQFAEKIGVLDRISQRILKEQFDLLMEINDWGPHFTLWSNCEDRLSGALSAVAKSIEKCYIALLELIDCNDSVFCNALREYILYTESVKVVLRKRDALQQEYNEIAEELSRRRAEDDPIHKQAESLNDRVTCANADLAADLDRWHRNKRKDFRRLFMSLAERQIQYYQKCLRAWEDAIPKIQKTDRDTDDSLPAETIPNSSPDV